MVEEGALLAITEMLNGSDASLILLLLNAVKHILMCGESEDYENDLAAQFEAIGGVRKLEILQHHENKQVYEMSTEIMKLFYETVEIECAPTETDSPEQPNINNLNSDNEK